MEGTLWIYDKVKKKSTPQALISLYIIASVVAAIGITFALLYYYKGVYGSVPKTLVYVIGIIMFALPVTIIMWNYIGVSSPRMIIRSYPIYLDEDDELWLFDYNSIAFEDYYDDCTMDEDGKLPRFSRFQGNHKERTIEYCVKHYSVKDIINNPPFESYAHHIVQVGKIEHKGGYLSVQYICHSHANNKNYQGGMAIPMDMTGIDELIEVLERKAAESDINTKQPKDNAGPGALRIERVYEEEDGCAIVYGIVEEGTITRGDRVNYTDADKNVIFECKASHIYRDGHEVVWATPVFDGNDPGYEVHIKKHATSEFQIGNYLRSK